MLWGSTKCTFFGYTYSVSLGLHLGFRVAIRVCCDVDMTLVQDMSRVCHDLPNDGWHEHMRCFEVRLSAHFLGIHTVLSLGLHLGFRVAIRVCCDVDMTLVQDMSRVCHDLPNDGWHEHMRCFEVRLSAHILGIHTVLSLGLHLGFRVAIRVCCDVDMTLVQDMSRVCHDLPNDGWHEHMRCFEVRLSAHILGIHTVLSLGLHLGFRVAIRVCCDVDMTLVQDMSRVCHDLPNDGWHEHMRCFEVRLSAHILGIIQCWV